MKLEEQVTSLELSKYLHELGVKQESLFYWELECGGNCRDSDAEPKISSKEYHDDITGEWGDCHLLSDTEHYSAFTASEILEMFKPEEERFWSMSFMISKSEGKTFATNVTKGLITSEGKTFATNVTKGLITTDTNLANMLAILFIHTIDDTKETK